jgi:hypothetical protein
METRGRGPPERSELSAFSPGFSNDASPILSGQTTPGEDLGLGDFEDAINRASRHHDETSGAIADMMARGSQQGAGLGDMLVEMKQGSSVDSMDLGRHLIDHFERQLWPLYEDTSGTVPTRSRQGSKAADHAPTAAPQGASGEVRWRNGKKMRRKRGKKGNKAHLAVDIGDNSKLVGLHNELAAGTQVMRNELEAALNEFRGGNNSLDLDISFMEETEQVGLDVGESSESSWEEVTSEEDSSLGTPPPEAPEMQDASDRSPVAPLILGDNNELLRKLADSEAQKAMVTDERDLLYAELERLRGQKSTKKRLDSKVAPPAEETRLKLTLEEAEAKKDILIRELANCTVEEIRDVIGHTHKDDLLTHWAAFAAMQRAVGIALLEWRQRCAIGRLRWPFLEAHFEANALRVSFRRMLQMMRLAKQRRLAAVRAVSHWLYRDMARGYEAWLDHNEWAHETKRRMLTAILQWARSSMAGMWVMWRAIYEMQRERRTLMARVILSWLQGQEQGISAMAILL